MRGDSGEQLPIYFAINVEAELPSNHPLHEVHRRIEPPRFDSAPAEVALIAPLREKPSAGRRADSAAALSAG